jgi:hypothetical protein
MGLVSPAGSEVTWAAASHGNTGVVAYTANTSGAWRARVHDPGYQTAGSLLTLGITVTDAATPTASPPPSGTPSPTPSRTATPQASATRTPTLTVSATAGASATSTRTATVAGTPTCTSTQWPDLVPRVYLPLIRRSASSAPQTPTRTPTRTSTGGATPTRTSTHTPTKTYTPPPIDVVIDPACSQFDAPGNDATNLNGEYVCFRNVGDYAADMHNWHVRDQDGHNTLLWEVALRPGAAVRLHSGSGTDTATDIYWGSDVEIWDNGGDTVYLRDASWNLVDQYSY